MQINITPQDILQYCNTYPCCEVQDIIKYLYQSIMGCEHLATEEFSALQRITSEAASAQEDTLPTVEPLAGDYCRLHLSALQKGLSPSVLCRLFLLSAGQEPSEKTDLMQQLKKAAAAVEELSDQGLLPFASSAAHTFVQDWLYRGCPPCHHSQRFRSAYHPAYRVIKKEYIRLLPLLTAIDTTMDKKAISRPGSSFILALEGRCASGKTTLAALLQKLYDCTVLHMDDFFLRPEQRTAARLQTPGENIDHERFLAEVLQPLCKGEAVFYRRYDCHSGALLPPTALKPAPLTVVEGVYCLHRSLIPCYDLKVFLQVSRETQRQRILKRNPGEAAEAFFTKWIPLEEAYFTGCGPQQLADLILKETC